jgi:hypothetical protein
VNADVIDVPVQPIVVKRNDRVGPVLPNDGVDLPLEQRAVGPSHISIGMIQNDDRPQPENARRRLEFLGADAAQIVSGYEPRLADEAALAARRAQQHHGRTQIGEPRERASARERLIVWVRKHRENGSTCQV